MNSRLQLRQTLSFSGDLPPPRYESEFSDEVAQAWRAEGYLGEQLPEEYFQLDPRETLPVEWRRKGDDKPNVPSGHTWASSHGATSPSSTGKSRF